MTKPTKCRLCLHQRTKWVVWLCPGRHQTCAKSYLAFNSINIYLPRIKTRSGRRQKGPCRRSCRAPSRRCGAWAPPAGSNSKPSMPSPAAWHPSGKPSSLASLVCPAAPVSPALALATSPTRRSQTSPTMRPSPWPRKRLSEVVMVPTSKQGDEEGVEIVILGRGTAGGLR